MSGKIHHLQATVTLRCGTVVQAIDSHDRTTSVGWRVQGTTLRNVTTVFDGGEGTWSRSSEYPEDRSFEEYAQGLVSQGQGLALEPDDNDAGIWVYPTNPFSRPLKLTEAEIKARQEEFEGR